MRLGIVSSALIEHALPDALDRVKAMGLDAVEIACAGFQPNLRHGDPAVLAHDEEARAAWLHQFEQRGLEISALSIHGQPLHPDPDIASRYDRQYRNACLLAEQVGVETLTLLGGLPAGAPGDRTPVWVVNGFPWDQADVLRWQWEERVIPYWTEHAGIAAEHGCRLAFEMHPMDVLHNPRSLLRLREAVGPTVGANVDPSHLFWQGMDPLEVVRELEGCIFHVHAKDSAVNDHVVRVNGVLDATAFSELSQRAWSFRTVGYGHDDLWWRTFVSVLREVGYDDVLSIEHEDEYMDLEEGVRKGVDFLAPMILRRPRGTTWYRPDNTSTANSR